MGRTDLSALAGVMTLCRTLVTNDSGAMHLAAAAGLGVTAMFGPTDDRATRPLGDAHAVLTHPVWCRPCMLRECPLDHQCMRGIGVDAGAGLGPKDAMKPAVFLDRDGTMIEDVGYLDSLSRIAFYPWTVDAIRMLNRADLAVVVVTNQSGIARGMFDDAFVARDTSRDRRASGGRRRPRGRVLLLSAPSGRQRRRRMRGAAIAGSPAAA